VLGLLTVSVLVNYMDRGNLSVAAPFLTTELNISPAQMGVLLSAFFWTYAVFQLVSGYLVDRYDVSKLYALGYLVWSIATLGTGFVGGFAALFAVRLMLGIAESVAYPCYSKILSESFTERQRGIANGLIDVGTKLGTAAGNLLGGWMIFNFGWRAFFIYTGAVSLFWLIPWMMYAPKPASEPSAERIAAGDDPGWAAIISQRAAWATFLGLFCFNYSWYFLLTWLPSYLMKDRHFTTQMMSVFSALPLAATAIATICAGLLSDRLIASGIAAVTVRKRFLVAGFLVTAAAMPMVPVLDDRVSMIALVIAFVGMGIFTSNNWALTQTLAGLSAVGKWTGAQNAVGNLAGVTAPVITGLIVQEFGSFEMAFFGAAAVALTGATLYGFVLDRTTPIRWSEVKRIS
jgi:ACS family D-galactonate transporter-like MFS transporter